MWSSSVLLFLPQFFFFFSMLYLLICFSSHRGCKVWLLQTSCQVKPAWTFSSDLFHQQGPQNCCLLSFPHLFLSKLCVKIRLDQQLLKYTAPAHLTPMIKVAEISFSPLFLNRTEFRTCICKVLYCCR